MGSNSGFQIGERCRPQSRFMDCLLLMCMVYIVLLFQYPVAVAWTLAAPQLMECCVFCTCTAIPFLGSPVFTAYLCSVILLHRRSGLSNVCELAVTAGHFIYNIPLLLHWGLLFHLHQHAPQCLPGSKDGLHA